MENIYHESERMIQELRSGRIKHRSIVKVQWSSGAIQYIRFHYWNKDRDELTGCDMQFDNLALEEFCITRGVVLEIISPTNILNNRRV